MSTLSELYPIIVLRDITVPPVKPRIKVVNVLRASVVLKASDNVSVKPSDVIDGDDVQPL
jgi:hypothetical protein